MPRGGRWVTGVAVGSYVALQVLGRQAGSTKDERRRRLPGDDVVRRPQMVTNHVMAMGMLRGLKQRAEASQMSRWNSSSRPSTS